MGTSAIEIPEKPKRIAIDANRDTLAASPELPLSAIFFCIEDGLNSAQVHLSDYDRTIEYELEIGREPHYYL